MHLCLKKVFIEKNEIILDIYQKTTKETSKDGSFDAGFASNPVSIFKVSLPSCALYRSLVLVAGKVPLSRGKGATKNHKSVLYLSKNKIKPDVLSLDIPCIGAVGGRRITAGFETLYLVCGDILVATVNAAAVELNGISHCSSDKSQDDRELNELHFERFSWT